MDTKSSLAKNFVERDTSIDVAKGIAIILMVLAHTMFSSYWDSWINMFHMPLFFFVAGYCFKEKYLKDFKSFAWNRVKKIYWPFIKYCILFLLLHNFFYRINLYNDIYGWKGIVTHLYDLKEIIRRSFYIISQMECIEQLLGGFWFLKSFFFASIISFFAIKFSRRVVMVGIFLIMTMLLSYFQIRLGFINIGARELLCRNFYISGWLYRGG